jgi:hypothetical protein
MIPILASALAIVLGAEVPVAAGASLPDAVARLAPGDTLRLGPGEHRGALGRLGGVRVEGAGAGVTVILAPQGEDGVVATGDLALTGLSIVTGPRRAALKVLGGAAHLHDVALVGGASGAFVETGGLEGQEVLLDGEYGLLSWRGAIRLSRVTASGRHAAVGVLGGTLDLARATLTGPATEAALSVAGGAVRLAEVVVRAPGPTGLAVSGGTLEARDVTVSGPRQAGGGLDGSGGVLGDCLQVRRGEVRLSASELVACGGAAVEASRARLWLDGVDAAGGAAGCLILTDRSEADLAATLCTRRGPGLVAMQGSKVRAFGARFWTDPAMWIDCGSGAEVRLLDAPSSRQPCTAPAVQNP